MRLFADVYNAAGARQGAGPVILLSASVSRVLDGIGTVQITVPGTDERALALLTNEARARLYFQLNDGSSVRELGRMIIRQLSASGTPDAWSLAATGPDELDELTRINTKMSRKYSADTVSDICSDLVSLVSGWSASASGGNVTDVRFDGLTVFKAINQLASNQGLHVRLGSSAKSVEVGAFGSDSGLRLLNPAQFHHSFEAGTTVLPIESISVEKNSEALCTRLFPFGAGLGDSMLTLEKSTRTTPYTIQSGTINGTTHYWIEDAAATSAFGLIEKVGKFSNIAPLSNSSGDMENAANAMYDLGAAWLTRYAQRQDVYRVTVSGAQTTVRPGDKLRMVYKGVVMRDGLVVSYLDIDDDFWVMECAERVDASGASLDLLLSTVDRHALDAARLVIGNLEELTIDGYTVKPHYNQAPLVYSRVIDPFHPALCPIVFTNTVQRLTRVLVTIVTGPFISTTLPDVSNTFHRHTIMTNDGVDRDYYWRRVTLYDDASETAVYAMLPLSIETDAFSLQTGTETNEDFISVEYGLHSDTQTPDTLRLFVNDVDYTSALGGPWAVGGGAATFTVDLTTAIETEAAGNLHQEFSVKLTCQSGQGEVEFRPDIYNIIQTIQV